MRRLVLYLLAAILGISSGLAVASAYEVTQITDETMTEAYRTGQRVLVQRNAGEMDFVRGDVVIFQNMMHMETGEGDVMVKRIIGMPGEWVEIRDGIVYIDEQPLDESAYLQEVTSDVDMGRRYVVANHYFVLGDNRENSTDSRSETVGLVKEKDLLGKVIDQW